MVILGIYFWYILVYVISIAELREISSGCTSLYRITYLMSYLCRRNNLDYIVDKICLQLRSPTASTKYSASSTIKGGSDGNNASTHLIVDFVFSTLDSTVQDSSEGSSLSNSEGKLRFLLLFLKHVLVVAMSPDCSILTCILQQYFLPANKMLLFFPQ